MANDDASAQLWSYTYTVESNSAVLTRICIYPILRTGMFIEIIQIRYIDRKICRRMKSLQKILTSYEKSTALRKSLSELGHNLGG